MKGCRNEIPHILHLFGGSAGVVLVLSHELVVAGGLYTVEINTYEQGVDNQSKRVAQTF